MDDLEKPGIPEFEKIDANKLYEALETIAELEKKCGESEKRTGERAEVEQPEVVGYRSATSRMVYEKDYGLQNPEPMMLVSQHDRIVGALLTALAAMTEARNRYNNLWNCAGNRLALAQVEIRKVTSERYAALAKLTELERQQPVAWMHDQPNRVDVIHRDVKDLLQRVPGSSRGIYRPLDVSEHYTIPLYAAPVAQAQHSVPVAREQLERLVRILDAHNYAKDAEALMALLAAAPGKEVPQAWLDVQAERRRQVEAEGWTPEHDDLYCAAELPRAAAAYILNGANDEAPAIWPFSAKWWKPRDARSNYVRASALILAEIERLDRAAPGKEGV